MRRPCTKNYEKRLLRLNERRLYMHVHGRGEMVAKLVLQAVLAIVVKNEMAWDKEPCLSLLARPVRHRRRPSPHTRPPPSFSGYHPCMPLSPSRLPSSFFNLCSSASHLRSATEYLFSSIPLPYCCSILLVALKINLSILHILFSLVLSPWLLLVLMVLSFFLFFF
jgi:hypothetical protein